MKLPIHWPHDADDGGETAVELRPFGTFLRQWAHDPLKTAALTPSGRHLARMMVAQLPPGASRVIEVGAGTGVFTRELLESGIAPSRLLVVEINPELANFLRKRFPDVTVACADARHVDTLAAQYGALGAGKLDAVVSGLGMLLMNSALRCAILSAAFAVLGPQGRFIQFTYGPASPVRRHERSKLGLSVRHAGFCALNLPPATVHVYQRMEPHAADRARG